MKGYTEFLGTVNRMTFDDAAERFTQVEVEHPFASSNWIESMAQQGPDAAVALQISGLRCASAAAHAPAEPQKPRCLLGASWWRGLRRG